MKSNPTPKPAFNRPLLEYARVLRRHQCSAIDHLPVFEILEKITKALAAIQNAYELMPSDRPGQWFLRSSYEFAHSNIRDRCARLRVDIDSIHPSLTENHQHSNTKALAETLNDLTHFLSQAANDLSCLSSFAVISAPGEPSTPTPSSLDDIFLSLEA